MERFGFLARFARNRGALAGALMILVVALAALVAPLAFPIDPLRIVGAPELWPGEAPEFPLGTDSLGRDILAMIVHGARATLLIGLAASVVATLIGVTVGAVAGYFGGWVDEVAMRAAERIGAEQEVGIVARPQLGRPDNAQRVGREEHRRQHGDQRHQQDDKRADQGAAVA